MAKESEIDGVTVTNAHGVIRKYFGERIYNMVVTNPDNFYFVLEPAATSELYIEKHP